MIAKFSNADLTPTITKNPVNLIIIQSKGTPPEIKEILGVLNMATLQKQFDLTASPQKNPANTAS